MMRSREFHLVLLLFKVILKILRLQRYGNAGPRMPVDLAISQSIELVDEDMITEEGFKVRLDDILGLLVSPRIRRNNV